MDKKELIRLSAAEVIAEVGYYKTNVRMIAKKAGIAVGTIYLYFNTKEEIVDSIFQIEHDKRIRYLKSLQERELPIKEVIQSFLDFHFKELKENPSINKVLIQEEISPLSSNVTSGKGNWRILPEILSEMLKIAEQKGQICTVDSTIAAKLIFQIIKGSVYIVQEDESVEWTKKVKEQILAFIFNNS